MRTALIFGILGLVGGTVTLGGCDGAGPWSSGGGTTGGALTVPPAGVAPDCDCRSAVTRVAGRRITVEDLHTGGLLLVRADGAPLCTDTLTGLGESGVLDVPPPNPGGTTTPSSSDPMPAHGGGDDKKGGGSTGGNTGGGGGGGGGGSTGGGEGNSDPMPADDTRRN